MSEVEIGVAGVVERFEAGDGDGRFNARRVTKRGLAK